MNSFGADQTSDSGLMSNYDIFVPTFIDDPHETYQKIRESACPIGRIAKNECASWLPTKYDDIVSISRDPATFSSDSVLLPRSSRWDADPYEGVLPIPIMIDPPRHGFFRELLQPYFSSQSVAKISPVIKQTCDQLVEIISNMDEVDVVPAYAQQVPAAVVGTLLGIPAEMRTKVATFAWKVQAFSSVTQDEADQAEIFILDYLRDLIEDKRTHIDSTDDDDVISALLRRSAECQLSENDLLGIAYLLILAGLDTTSSVISASIWYLAEHQDQRKRLIEDKTLWPTAIEEFIRFFSPVMMSRTVKRNVVFQGCPMRAGDQVLLPYASACRDPEEFNNPDHLVLERKKNHHVAFGSGIHYCLGAQFARIELKTALQVWLKHFPDYSLCEGQHPVWIGPGIRALQSCIVHPQP